MQGHIAHLTLKMPGVQSERNVLFLYTRLPDYFYRCIQRFVTLYPYTAVVIRYRGDTNTRYIFEPDDRITLLYKDEVNVIAVIKASNPAAIMLSGWSDQLYVAATRSYVKLIPVILGLDNPWSGTFRQYILSKAAPWYVRRFCNKVWVAGRSQYEYARRLGFAGNQIRNGVYSADTDRFYLVNEVSSLRKRNDFPHTMVYVGRLVDYKQPHILAGLFNEVVAAQKLQWKLILAGEGPLKPAIESAIYPHVEITHFIDPAALPEFYSHAGIFCLPSIGEHWGVAVHEAAAAGMPLLLSDSVEAKTEFLLHGFNGLSFESGNEASLKQALLKILCMPDKDLMLMGDNSIELSKRISVHTWAATLNSILEES